MGLFNEGDFFGYTALLEETVYKENAEAIEDAELAVIAKEDFEKLIFSNLKCKENLLSCLQKMFRKEKNIYWPLPIIH